MPRCKKLWRKWGQLSCFVQWCLLALGLLLMVFHGMFLPHAAILSRKNIHSSIFYGYCCHGDNTFGGELFWYPCFTSPKYLPYLCWVCPARRPLKTFHSFSQASSSSGEISVIKCVENLGHYLLFFSGVEKHSSRMGMLQPLHLYLCRNGLYKFLNGLNIFSSYQNNILWISYEIQVSIESPWWEGGITRLFPWTAWATLKWV